VRAVVRRIARSRIKVVDNIVAGSSGDLRRRRVSSVEERLRRIEVGRGGEKKRKIVARVFALRR
jgi:hypothetical protein